MCVCTQFQASDHLKEQKHLSGVRKHKDPTHSLPAPHALPHGSHTRKQGARPYLFCGKSAQHSGVANTKLQGKDMERRSWAA